jgi:hypothetical protein
VFEVLPGLAYPLSAAQPGGGQRELRLLWCGPVRPPSGCAPPVRVAVAQATRGEQHGRRSCRAAGQPLGLEVDGETRSTHDTQEEAISDGRSLAEQEQGELVIHGEDGEIREKGSHGNDPRNIPG